MDRYIQLAQVIVSVSLIVTILLQNKGSSLGSAFGGDSFGSYHTKRGFEKFLVYFSVVLAVLFLLLALFGAYIAR